MRAVVQRVTSARVTVDGQLIGAIEHGLLVFVGIGQGDDPAVAKALADKVIGLRIFVDSEGKMNRALPEVRGALLAVSQFTLFGDVRKGLRPSFSSAMAPGSAEVLFEAFCAAARAHDVRVETGRFRADMQVELVNDGPVTILIDTERAF